MIKHPGTAGNEGLIIVRNDSVISNNETLGYLAIDGTDSYGVAPTAEQASIYIKGRTLANWGSANNKAELIFGVKAGSAYGQAASASEALSLGAYGSTGVDLRVLSGGLSLMADSPTAGARIIDIGKGRENNALSALSFHSDYVWTTGSIGYSTQIYRGNGGKDANFFVNNNGGGDIILNASANSGYDRDWETKCT